MHDDLPILIPGAASEPPIGGGSSLSRIRVGEREQLRPPREIQARLTKAGGLNIFNGPNFLLRWGWEPTEFIYSLTSGCYELRPRYFGASRSRWIVEKWFPPEYYGTPGSWRWTFTQNINGIEVDLLGPFPSRGAYEQLCTIQTPDGQYLALTSALVDQMVDLVRVSRDLSPWARKARVVEQIENPDPGFDAWADDLLRDKQPVFDLNPHVFLGNRNKLPEKWKGDPA